MKLSNLELQLCAVALDKELKGLSLPEVDPEWEDDAWTEKGEVIKEKLLQEGMMEQAEEGYRFSDFGQLILNILGEADGWFSLENEKAGMIRRIYVKDADYLCVDEKEDGYEILYLPLLPLAIGAYAEAVGNIEAFSAGEISGNVQEMWESRKPYLRISGISGSSSLQMELTEGGIGKKTVSDNTDYALFTEESCINTITMWLLEGLKESGGVTDGE